jgi:hypothetical protein
MMMKWFGPTWDAPINKECEEMPVPVGEPCTHCDELFVEGEQGVMYANGPYAHIECFMRGIAGSVAHQLGTCGCYVPGSAEGDPPELTRRQAAKVALQLSTLLQNPGYRRKG